MKLVSLLITVMLISFSAAAQTSTSAAAKSSVAKVQQKTNTQKAKAYRPKTVTGDNTDVTILKDETSHKAKWSFEQMLQRRLEIDAEDGARLKRKEQVF